MCLLTSLPMHGGFPRATARRMPPLRPFARQNVCRGPTESVRYTGAWFFGQEFSTLSITDGRPYLLGFVKIFTCVTGRGGKETG